MLHIDATWLSYLMAAVTAYFVMLFTLALFRSRRTRPQPAGDGPMMVVLVAARNEELVIERTVRGLLAQSYADTFVMVINDASTDATAEIVRSFEGSGNVMVLDRDPNAGGRGKGRALNDGYHVILDLMQRGDGRFAGRRADDIVIAVMDADGVLSPDTFAAVAPYFADPAVGGVQIGVRISNAADSFFARLQDIEFVGFSGLVQDARDPLGSVGLGGNGQFTRLAALESLERDPWSSCLTEDLDLGLSLVEQGWRIRYCPDSFVAQQGLTRARPLFRQRTRWIQGHYQCWRHIPKIVSSKKIRLRTRLDLLVYLLFVTLVVIVTAGFAMSFSAWAGLVQVTNHSLDVVPGPARNGVLEVVSLGPLGLFMVTYQRRSVIPLRWWEVPAYAVAFAAYCYVFIISQVVAWVRIATGRNNWVKTPRVIDSGSLLPADA